MLGISTSSFYGHLSTEDAVYKIAEAGVDCAEVFLNSFSEYSNEFISMISGRLKECGLVFNSVHTLPTQFEPQLFSSSKRQKEDAVYFLKTVMEASAKAGCHIYVMHGKPFYKKNIGSFKVDVEMVSDVLNELCETAESYNMEIGLENVHWAMCNNIEFVNSIKSRVSKLKFTLDIKQAYFAETDWQDYIAAFGNRLINVHICDYKEKKTCLPGQGEVDFVKFNEILNNSGYDRNIILEVYKQDYCDFNDLQNCINFCKEIFRGW